MSQRGMTLVELVIGTAILVGGGGALLMGMNYAMLHEDYLSDFQVAMNAAQGRLEELSATEFSTLWSPIGEYAFAQTAAGQCMGMGEDRDCDGVQDANEPDLNGNGALDEPLAGGRLWVRIQSSIPAAANPTLLDLYVSACWTTRGRAISEDVNCNGRLDAGEDVNANGLLDAPVSVSTRVATGA